MLDHVATSAHRLRSTLCTWPAVSCCCSGLLRPCSVVARYAKKHLSCSCSHCRRSCCCLSGHNANLTRTAYMLLHVPTLPCLVRFNCCCHAAIGRLCEKCDGKCPICDSYVRPATLVRVCDECNYGSYEGRCVICGGIGVSDAYYCKECTLQEKDVSRDCCTGLCRKLLEGACRNAGFGSATALMCAVAPQWVAAAALHGSVATKETSS
jgi:hypothetical protein